MEEKTKENENEKRISRSKHNRKEKKSQKAAKKIIKFIMKIIVVLLLIYALLIVAQKSVWREKIGKIIGYKSFIVVSRKHESNNRSRRYSNSKRDNRNRKRRYNSI